jgi:hypothetical protein
MDPRSWLQSNMHNLLRASITFIVCLVIFCIGYSCLQWQLKSYKTSEAMVTLGLLCLKNNKGGIVRASSGNLPVWVSIWPCEKAPRNWGKSLRTRLCLFMYKLVLGLMRKLQGTGAKVSDQTVPVWVGIWPCEKARHPENNIQGSQMASCPSDVNKKVMLTLCFSCFSVPILKET